MSEHAPNTRRRLIGVVVIVVVAVAGWRGTTRDLAALVVSGLWFGLRWTKWRTTNFVVTTDRLIYRSGVVAKAGKTPAAYPRRAGIPERQPILP